MKIRIMSDLHLEFFSDRWRRFVENIPNDCDVLVLAGDITSSRLEAPNLSAVLYPVCERFEHVVFVTGNHEYYGTSPGALHNEANLVVSMCEGKAQQLDRRD